MAGRMFVAFLTPLLAISLAVSSVLAGILCGPFDYRGIQECQAGISSELLDVTASDTQHASEWCWAACIEAVFAYYGHAVSQERIVSETWGSIENIPASPAMLLHALNRKWTDDEGNVFRVKASTLTTTAVAAAQDLDNDRPLIIGSLGHAMVLTALTYARDGYGRGVIEQAIVRDPWPYNPQRRFLSPVEWNNIAFAARIRVDD